MNGLTKEQMLDKYKVLGFAFGLCIVEDKESGVQGTLEFHQVDGVRMYHSFAQA